MKKLTILGVGLLILLIACNTNRTEQENIDKLLESQAEMQKAQEESIDQLDRIKDTLNKKRNASYEDSISLMKKDLSQLDSKLDSIEESLDLYKMQETRTEKFLESGIDEIDQRMTSRENRKQQEIKRVPLLRKRIVISEKKIETYKLEQQLYVDERDAIRRSNASEEELVPYEKRIAEMDEMIQTEKENKRAIEKDVRQAETFIAETDALIDDMRVQIQEEYDKKEVIEAFIASEKERLQRELGQIQMTRKALLAEQAIISNNLVETEEEIATINRDVELIKNEEMSDILEKQAAIEQSEAELAEEEISLMEEGYGSTTESAEPISEFAGEELLALVALGNELDSLNDLIQAEKAEIAKTRKDLSEKRAEAASHRARFGRTIGGIFIFLIIGGVALLALFYYLGIRSRRSKYK